MTKINKKYKNNSEIKLAVIGGDVRQLWLARALNADGYEVAVYGFGDNINQFINYNYNEPIIGGSVRCSRLSDALGMCDAVILPLPYSSDGQRVNCPLGGDIALLDIFNIINHDTLVLGGRLDDNAKKLAQLNNLNITLEDYFELEEVCVLNSIPTAEGAAAVAMAELPITLHCAKAAVLGFGRVARAVAKLLSGFGADITVAARKESDLAWIKLYGYKPLDFNNLDELIINYDLIINTVPELIIKNNFLENFAKNPPFWKIIIDLASKPGGVDHDAAKAHGVKLIHALSLPGRVSPATSGMILRGGVIALLEKHNIKADINWQGESK